jgi:hypothetical protein
MAKHKLFAIPGTWEAVAAANGNPAGITPNEPVGVLTGITDQLNTMVFDVQYVNYPESFGPVPGGGESLLAALGNPSYVASRDMGIAEVIRLISEYQGTFGLLGFSQGGAIASLVGRELVSGLLKDRLSDCLWVHAIASPHRGIGHTFYMGNKLSGQGISGDNITEFGTIDWSDFCLPGDIYGNADLPDTYLQVAYQLAIELSLSDPVATIEGIAESLVYGALGKAIAQLGDNPLLAISKTALTAADIAAFLITNPHAQYGVLDIIPGSTALDWSAGYLNYWGPRLA